MIVSDEPGYYLDTKFGIRIETCLYIFVVPVADSVLLYSITVCSQVN